MPFSKLPKRNPLKFFTTLATESDEEEAQVKEKISGDLTVIRDELDVKGDKEVSRNVNKRNS